MTAPRTKTVSSKPPMPVFGDAYLSDTHHLTLEEHGAYWKLLLIAWQTSDCALPDDDKRLAMMLGVTPKKWAKLKPVIMSFWRLDGDRWRQKRQTNVRRFVEEKREHNRDAAFARWNNQDHENKGDGESERISGRKTKRISEGNASQTQSHKEKSSVAKATAASGDDFDPVKDLFDRGIEVLGEAKIPEAQARSIVGRWRKEYGDDLVSLAIAAASGKYLSQPLEWIAKRLQTRAAERQKPAPGSRSHADVVLEEMEAERLREARQSNQPSAKKRAGATA